MSRLILPGLIKAMFAPADVQAHYRDLDLPVVIITGADDQIADVGR